MVGGDVEDSAEIEVVVVLEMTHIEVAVSIDDEKVPHSNVVNSMR